MNNMAHPEVKKSVDAASGLLKVVGKIDDVKSSQGELFVASTTDLVFTSRAAYQFWVVLLLAIGPLSIIAACMATWMDQTMSYEEKFQGLKILFFSFVFVLVLYVFVMPHHFEVCSDASIRIVTWPMSYKFGHVIAAYENPPIFSLRPKIKFATDLTKRVLVQRKNGWDILLSPVDPKGYVDAVWKVVSQSDSLEEKITPRLRGG